MKKLERIHLLSRADKLKPLRAFVRQLVINLQCCDTTKDDMVMAINEACMNIMQHAYNGREDEEIIVEFWKDHDDFLVRIFDTAKNLDHESIKSRDLDDVRPGGLGVYFIHEVMDAVHYKHQENQQGNVLELRKKIQYQASM